VHEVVALSSQSPHLLVTTFSELSVCVAHQGVGESAKVHFKYSTPLYLKGKTQAWPDLVEHVFGILCSKLKNASSLTASLPGAHNACEKSREDSISFITFQSVLLSSLVLFPS